MSLRELASTHAAGRGLLAGADLAADEAVTWSTVTAMDVLARESATDSAIMSLAWSLTAGARSIDEAIASIFAWLQQNVSFVEDAANVAGQGVGRLTRDAELLISPARLLAMPEPAGDCDEFSMAFKALATAAGLDVDICFATIAADQTRPDEYSHVFCVVDGRAVDASHGPRPGWIAAPGAVTRFGSVVKWTGKYREWVCERVSRLQGLGAVSLRETLINAIPGAIETGQEVLLRRGTPTGYYRSNSEGVETRLPGGSSSALSIPSLASGGFPWATVLALGAVAMLVVLGRKR